VTAKFERRLKALALTINAVVLAELVVYVLGGTLFGANFTGAGYALLNLFLVITAACALMNIVILSLLIMRGRTLKPTGRRWSLLLIMVSALFLAFAAFPLVSGLSA
jgi:hypothetical protein